MAKDSLEVLCEKGRQISWANLVEQLGGQFVLKKFVEFLLLDTLGWQIGWKKIVMKLDKNRSGGKNWLKIEWEKFVENLMKKIGWNLCGKLCGKFCWKTVTNIICKVCVNSLVDKFE